MGPERSGRKKLLAPAQESNYTTFQIRPVSGLVVYNNSRSQMLAGLWKGDLLFLADSFSCFVSLNPV